MAMSTDDLERAYYLSVLTSGVGLGTTEVTPGGGVVVSPTYSDTSLGTATLIAGSSTLNNSAASTPIVTVAAGRTFKGSITLTICNTGVAAATFDTISALTAGAGVTPVVGSILLMAQTHANGTAAQASDITVHDIIVRAPVGNSVTINAQLSAAAATLNGTCSITGVLVA